MIESDQVVRENLSKDPETLKKKKMVAIHVKIWGRVFQAVGKQL